ncbi:MAG: ABC transporter ATP-binding protein/permease, partial [Firmicutes bacterium]|nr:ABC transporter ATP-binding protein/permease [Candidatus Colimorpha enterica]
KTTLLNIIGGLDQYTSGDLEIRGRSTKNYSDRDWDTYRNHSIGFVFQSYNLIPHQTVLSNVELALTLSGVKKSERKRRATEALERVGLGDQMNKKPNQLSGGQMQRVAIARAIVNDPEILLADEPTGALDSETSVQVMDILREIANDRLVIMVTHNPELAERYSDRIIRLKDGLIVDDSRPIEKGENESTSLLEKAKNRSMSFFTALGLSVNNLLTKKGRTIMTCFAGSIGIIGIALILSVSNGVNNFINKIQEDTLTKYPLTIDAESVDMTAMLEGMAGTSSDDDGKDDDPTIAERDEDRVYATSGIAKIMKAMTSITTSKNNVTDFKKHIEKSAEFKKYASAVKYSYNLSLNMYYTDADGKIAKSDSGSVLTDMYAAMGVTLGGTSSSMLSSYSTAMSVWEEMLSGSNGELISPILTEQYDIMAGKWPESYDEAVIVVNERNELSDFVLYSLGLKSSEEFSEIIKAAMEQKEIDISEDSWSADEITSLSFRLILPCDCYRKQSDGKWLNLSSTEAGMKILYNDPASYTEIKIVGIIRPNENALFNMMTGAIGYTSKLTEYIISRTEENELVKAQLADKDTDAILGLPFRTEEDEPTADEKLAAVKEWIASLSAEEKAELYVEIMSTPTADYIKSAFEGMTASMTRDELTAQILTQYAENMGTTDTEKVKSYLDSMSEEELHTLIYDSVAEMISAAYSQEVRAKMSMIPAESLAMMLDPDKLTEGQIDAVYKDHIPSSFSDSDYASCLADLGYVDKDSPKVITIYASTFENKNKISDLVDEYNKSVKEEDKIKMTDYVKLLMSSVSTVINAISYVLIAFVGISLVVSSIMIGVITNISVLERTKEIGILRAVGASKKDIGLVFNAETFIIGLFAGVIGIAVTLILIVPINLILHHFTGLAYLSAALPVGGAVLLVLLSFILTVIAGIIPARAASNKDPVIALRSE